MFPSDTVRQYSQFEVIRRLGELADSGLFSAPPKISEAAARLLVGKEEETPTEGAVPDLLPEGEPA